MDYTPWSFRHGLIIAEEERFSNTYLQIGLIIDSITDEELMARHEKLLSRSGKRPPKSLSIAINQLLKEKFTEYGWKSESPIFEDPEYDGSVYDDKVWRLDFAKDLISVEVAFNHGEAIAWNLLKPVLASELNHVKKAINTELGVIITATSDLKRAGCFDGAVGEYDKFIRYLKPLSAVLSVPLIIIGLEPPGSFRLKEVVENKKKVGRIVRMANTSV